MTDPEFMLENLWDDLMVQLHLLARDMVNTGVDVKGLSRLAEILGLPEVDLSSPERMMHSAGMLRNSYSFEATKYILEKSAEFCRKRGKKLLVVHFDPYGVMKQLVMGEERYDREVIDVIQTQKIRYFDMNQVHVDDYRQFNLSLEEYMDRYFIGHYNPSGNHFFAYALKDELVDWLEPNPITYQKDDSKLIRFKGYLDM